MSLPTTLSSLVAISLAAGSLSAQQPVSAARPAPAPAGTLWGTTPVGRYNVVADDNGTPNQAVLTLLVDSTGHNIAVVTLADGQNRKLTLQVKEPDLLLEAVEENGSVMRMKLDRQGDSVSGTWTHGMNGGTVKGMRASAAASPAAASSAPATPWAADPTGKFNLVADVDGSPRNATLTMTLDPTTHHTKAIIVVEGGETDEMRVTVSGPDLVLETDTDAGLMSLKLQRHGNDLTGSWTRGVNGGTIKGTPAP